MKLCALYRIAAVLILVAAWPLAAQQPVSSPPVFPGAAPDSAAMAERGDTGEGQEIRAYSTSASIEDVFLYYKSQLSATPAPENPPDLSRLRPGSATPVFFGLSFHESLSGQQSASLKAKRKPYDNSRYIQNASFDWIVKEGANKFTSHSIQLEDRSFDDGSYAPKTVIILQRESGGMPEDEAEADRDARREELRKAQKQQAPVSPLSAQELGAPLYAGAVFNAEATASFQQAGTKCYIYLSTDTPGKVAAFYASNLGIQPSRDSDGRFLFTLKGKLPYPEWGIEIMPNRAFDKKFKSVISFASWSGPNSGENNSE